MRGEEKEGTKPQLQDFFRSRMWGKCEEQQHCCRCPTRSCVVRLLSRDSGVGETWMGPAEALPAPGAAGEGSYTALALGMGWVQSRE